MSLQDLYAAAVQYTNSGQYAEAIRKCELILTNDIGEVDKANVCSLLGSVYLMVGDNEKGVQRLVEALAITPNNANGWSNLSEGWRRLGRLVDALETARKAVALKPNHADAHNNMGNALQAHAKLDEAITSYLQALTLKPDYAEAYNNVGVALKKQGKLDEAIISFRRALALKPNYADAYRNMGNALQALGKLDEAITSYRQALTLKPDNADAFNNIGAALQAQGKPAEAIISYRQALKVKPNSANTHNNMGVALKTQGKLNEAITSYRHALVLKPDHADAYLNMGNVFKAQSRPAEAIESYRQAIKWKPDLDDAYFNIGDLLTSIKFTKPTPGMPEIIHTLLEKNNFIRPISVAGAAISLLKQEPLIKELIKNINDQKSSSQIKETVISLSNFPILMKLMELCPIPDLDIEILLKFIRSALLINLSKLQNNHEIIPFQISLSMQCFINEYLYEETDLETQKISELEEYIKNNITKEIYPSANELACLSSYKSLREYPWINSVYIPDQLNSLYLRQALEPEKEKVLMQNIRKFQSITDNISSKVREQYEQNPYPRWMKLKLPRRPRSISEILKEGNIRPQYSRIFEVSNPKILVAGCGTGQHSIETASRFKNCDILAIDLSLSSLAYAKRKTDELNISNIEYMRVDILDIGKLRQKFDIIESVGVLHHMHDPMAGWKALVRCLNTGGLMRIGVYSELARRNIVRIRNEIRKDNIKFSDYYMRSFRNRIINLERECDSHIKSSPAFYNMSSIRDLLFHVQEHRFTIAQIEKNLDDLGLIFCGFEQPNISQNISSNILPIDDIYCLKAWEDFEVKNPDTFLGMYQFWCQKKIN